MVDLLLTAYVYRGLHYFILCTLDAKRKGKRIVHIIAKTCQMHMLMELETWVRTNTEPFPPKSADSTKSRVDPFPNLIIMKVASAIVDMSSPIDASESPLSEDGTGINSKSRNARAQARHRAKRKAYIETVLIFPLLSPTGLVIYTSNL